MFTDSNFISNINKKRSIRITLFGWFLILTSSYALFVILPFIANVLLSMAGSYSPPSEISPALHFLKQVIMLIAVATVVGKLVGGILILKLKEKGRKFVIILSSIDLMMQILNLIILRQYLLENISNIISSFIPLIFNIFIIYFLTRLQIKQEFTLKTSMQL